MQASPASRTAQHAWWAGDNWPFHQQTRAHALRVQGGGKTPPQTCFSTLAEKALQGSATRKGNRKNGTFSTRKASYSIQITQEPEHTRNWEGWLLYVRHSF